MITERAAKPAQQKVVVTGQAPAGVLQSTLVMLFSEKEDRRLYQSPPLGKVVTLYTQSGEPQ